MIAFTCGGTGGHVYPVLALAQELDHKHCYFIGSRDRKDSDILPAYGYRILPIVTYKKNPILFLTAFFQSIYILKTQDTRIVVSSGGATTVPVVLAAKVLGIPIFLLEQNTLPGRANRFLARFAKKIGVTFPQSLPYFPADKTTVTGNPIRKAFPTTPAYYQLVTETWPKAPILLVIGGSQGAGRLNELIGEQTDYFINQPYALIHILGKSHFEKQYPGKEYKLIKDTTGQVKVCLLPYFEKMDYLYSLATLVISRAGATTLAELNHFKKPAILIPYPYAKDNHQYWNAKAAEEEGTAILLPESELTFPVLMTHVQTMIADPPVFGESPDARQTITRELQAYVEAA